MFENLTVLTCNFNNSEITLEMLRSLYITIDYPLNVTIMDNSTSKKLNIKYNSFFNIIDNTNFKLTPNYNQVSKNHSASIDYALKNIIKTDYVLLCDNDVIFKPATKKILTNKLYEQYDIIGEINADVTPPERLLPYFCFINLKKVLKYNINYFNNDLCIPEYSFKLFPNFALFDTGYSFLQELRQNNFSIKQIYLNDYVTHFGHLSHSFYSNNSTIINNYKKISRQLYE